MVIFYFRLFEESWWFAAFLRPRHPIYPGRFAIIYLVLIPDGIVSECIANTMQYKVEIWKILTAPKIDEAELALLRKKLHAREQ